MKGWLVVATIIALAVFVVPTAMAAEAYWGIDILGEQSIYTYLFMSTGETDVLTSFHVFAPIDPTDVIDWSADQGWLFSATIDSESGVTDLCWYAENPENGLGAFDFLQVSVTTLASISTDENYTLPDYLGNWGYKTLNYMDQYPTIIDSTVGVPTKRLSEVPEPASLLALITGCAMLRLRRRK